MKLTLQGGSKTAAFCKGAQEKMSEDTGSEKRGRENGVEGAKLKREPAFSVFWQRGCSGREV